MSKVNFADLFGLHPKQIEAIEMIESRPFGIYGYGGGGGGGKSYLDRAAAVWSCLRYAQLGFPGQKVTLACATYGLVRDRHYAKFEDEYRQFGRVRSDHRLYGTCFEFSDERYGAILFRNLDDPDKYRGTEVAGAIVDELTEIPEKINNLDVLPQLLYPIRSSQGLPFSYFLGTFNPDGIGSRWVKRIFITQDGRGDWPDDIFGFIQALPGDNPKLPASWIQMLQGYPEHIRRARLYGDWSAPEGARFPQLRESVHNVRTRDLYPDGMPPNYRKISGGDWGMAAPYCHLWTVLDRDGNPHTYREDYKAGLTYDEQVDRILRATGADEVIEATFLDPAMWARRRNEATGEIGKSAVDVYAERLPLDGRFQVPRRGFNKSRGHALASLDRLLNRGNGYPDWTIDKEACPNLWSELQNAVFDTRGLSGVSREDIDPRVPDHAITAAYYHLHTYFEHLWDAETVEELPSHDVVMAAWAEEQNNASIRSFETRFVGAGKRRL